MVDGLTGGGWCTTLSCMTTLTIRLPKNLRTDLDKISRAESKAVSDIVRESLRRYVAVEKFRAVRRKVLPFAEAQGLLTDEDVFKALS
jgi:predicted transcriptional regulator